MMKILASRRAVEIMLLLTLLIMIAAFFALHWAASPENVQGVIGRKSLDTSFTALKLAQADADIYSTEQPIALVVMLACMVIAAELTLVNLWRSFTSRRVVILRAVFGIVILVVAILSRSIMTGIDVDSAYAPAGSSFDINSDSIFSMTQGFYITVIGAILMILPLGMLRKGGVYALPDELPEDDDIA